MSRERALSANRSVGCTGCHLDHFQGDGTVPRLAGQGRDYLAKTMADFRTRARGNNPGMSDLMIATSPDDLAALAEYLAGLCEAGSSQRLSAASAVSRKRSDSTVRSAARFPALSLSDGSAPRAEQQFGDLGMAAFGRDHQRGAPAGIPVVDMGAGVEQIGDDLDRLRFRRPSRPDPTPTSAG